MYSVCSASRCKVGRQDGHRWVCGNAETNWPENSMRNATRNFCWEPPKCKVAFEFQWYASRRCHCERRTKETMNLLRAQELAAPGHCSTDSGHNFIFSFNHFNRTSKISSIGTLLPSGEWHFDSDGTRQMTIFTRKKRNEENRVKLPLPFECSDRLLSISNKSECEQWPLAKQLHLFRPYAATVCHAEIQKKTFVNPCIRSASAASSANMSADSDVNGDVEHYSIFVIATVMFGTLTSLKRFARPETGTSADTNARPQVHRLPLTAHRTVASMYANLGKSNVYDFKWGQNYWASNQLATVDGMTARNTHSISRTATTSESIWFDWINFTI